jgi:hypothetical protein
MMGMFDLATECKRRQSRYKLQSGFFIYMGPNETTETAGEDSRAVCDGDRKKEAAWERKRCPRGEVSRVLTVEDDVEAKSSQIHLATVSEEQLDARNREPCILFGNCDCEMDSGEGGWKGDGIQKVDQHWSHKPRGEAGRQSLCDQRDARERQGEGSADSKQRVDCNARAKVIQSNKQRSNEQCHCALFAE